jgi:glyoxylase-like metal-dependent hydrolase (beta-lactamase superfamily II)
MSTARRCSTSRRALLRGIAAGVGTMALPRFANVGFAAGVVAATPVASDLTLLEGAGGNVLVFATEAGKVLVDSGATAFTSDLLATVETLPGGAVTTLFNTHWHLDQVGGNETLGAGGVAIVAHEKTRLRLRTGYYLPTEDRYEKPLPEAALPMESFHTTHATSIGGRRIECGYLLEAHTDGDIYVAFPDANVVAVGDVLAPARDPVFERADAQAEHDMLLELFDRMVVHVRLGESSEDMLAAGVLEGLGRTFEDPAGLLYSLHKGFWAHHNKLTHDIV